MTDLVDLLATAAAEERAKYVVEETTTAGAWALFSNEEEHFRAHHTYATGILGAQDACQAHLERLVAKAVLRALHASGYRIVPVEPTPEMLREAKIEMMDDDEALVRVWRAMLSASEGETA